MASFIAKSLWRAVGAKFDPLLSDSAAESEEGASASSEYELQPNESKRRRDTKFFESKRDLKKRRSVAAAVSVQTPQPQPQQSLEQIEERLNPVKHVQTTNETATSVSSLPLFTYEEERSIAVGSNIDYLYVGEAVATMGKSADEPEPAERDVSCPVSNHEQHESDFATDGSDDDIVFAIDQEPAEEQYSSVPKEFDSTDEAESAEESAENDGKDLAFALTDFSIFMAARSKVPRIKWRHRLI